MKEFIKEHTAFCAIVLGAIIMLVAGVLMIASKGKKEDNGKHLTSHADEYTDSVYESDDDTDGTDNIVDGLIDSTDGGNDDGTVSGSDGVSDNPDSEEFGNLDTSVPSDEDISLPNETFPSETFPSETFPSETNPDVDKPSDESGNTETDGGDNPNVPDNGEEDKTPMDEEDAFLSMGIAYVVNSDGTVTITGGKLKGDVVIPATIEGKPTIVGDRAFYSYGSVSNVTSLIIKSKEVCAGAFGDCENLVSVTFSAEVEKIGESAFADCDKLQNVIFEGDKITEIPKGLFNRCPNITSITLPKSVTKVNAGFITSGNYFTSSNGIQRPNESDYVNYVPEFTVYVYNEPSEVWTENNADGYKNTTIY